MPRTIVRQMSIDAAVRFSQLQDQDVSAADSANKVPLFVSSEHDIRVVGIESVVTKAGDTNGADVTINIGTIATPALIGTVVAAKAATPAINVAEAGTMAAGTDNTDEGRGGVLIPKGTPVYATYTNSGSNVAQRAVGIRYIVVDEHYES